MKLIRKIAMFAINGFAWACTMVFLLWAAGALWYFTFFPQPLGPILAIALLAAFALLIFRIRPRTLWLPCAGTAIIATWLLTLTQQPTHDRRWAKEQMELSEVLVHKGDVVIENFRQNKYQSESDYEVNRSRFRFSLRDLKKVWFIVQRFAPGEGLAHVFLSFEVSTVDRPPQWFSVSVEIRREDDEFFSPIQGLYRQYELNYVFGSEPDLIGVRTVMRPEDRVFMYPVNATPEQVQELFLGIAERTNRIYRQPEFYHTLLNNCMNGILRHTVELTPEEISWFDPQIILPGYSDRYAFKKGIIGSPEQTFEELKEACRIDRRARNFGIRSGFSQAIRNLAN